MLRQTAYDPSDDLWEAYAAHPDGPARDHLIERYRRLAMSVLRGLGHRWDEDLEQVAMLGLMKAVDRFDPMTGNHFSSFAVPTIVGEVKRYLRDNARIVRPPRSLLDLHVAVLAKEQELTRAMGRPPTLAEVAAALGVDLDRVVEALAMEETCRPRSLDAILEAAERDQPTPLQDRMGAADPEMERAENRTACRQLLGRLDRRLREVIQLRYFGNLTQAETARSLGVSQMQISRLERRALEQMRGDLIAA